MDRRAPDVVVAGRPDAAHPHRRGAAGRPGDPAPLAGGRRAGAVAVRREAVRDRAADRGPGALEGVGYLLKDRVVQVDEFLDALERVAAGRAAFDPEVVRRLLARSTHTDPLARLTARERDVLDAMAQGHTNATIAARLHVSQSAVEKHINAIFDKLGLTGARGLLAAGCWRCCATWRRSGGGGRARRWRWRDVAGGPGQARAAGQGGPGPGAGVMALGVFGPQGHGGLGGRSAAAAAAAAAAASAAARPTRGRGPCSYRPRPRRTAASPCRRARPGRSAGAEDSAMGRLSSKVSSQERQRYS